MKNEDGVEMVGILIDDYIWNHFAGSLICDLSTPDHFRPGYTEGRLEAWETRSSFRNEAIAIVPKNSWLVRAYRAISVSSPGNAEARYAP